MKRQLATLGIAGRVGLSLLPDASSRTRLPLQKNSNVGAQPVSLVYRHCIAVVAGLVRDWFVIGSGLVRDWFEIGSGLVRDWFGIGSGLVRD